MPLVFSGVSVYNDIRKEGFSMAIQFKFNIMEALKEEGYTSTRLRNEKLMGESYMTQLRRGELVSWATIDTICRLLKCHPGEILEYKEEG